MARVERGILSTEDSKIHGCGTRFDQQQILIVENEFIPRWHLENLREARLLYRLPGAGSNPHSESTVNDRTNSKRAKNSASNQGRYYKGRFPIA